MGHKLKSQRKVVMEEWGWAQLDLVSYESVKYFHGIWFNQLEENPVYISGRVPAFWNVNGPNSKTTKWAEMFLLSFLEYF